VAADPVEFGGESGDSLAAGSGVVGRGPELPDDALRRLSLGCIRKDGEPPRSLTTQSVIERPPSPWNRHYAANPRWLRVTVGGGDNGRLNG